MRLANIIIAHKNPLQLERLIRKMRHPNFDFYIHLDKKIDIKSFEYLKKIEGVYFIENRIVCNWGGYSTLEAMLGSLKEVFENKIDYGFYNLISAQDYPIKTNEEIYQFFASNTQKSFIFYETEDAGNWWKGAVYRYKRYHLTEFNFKGKSFVERMINIVLPERKFPMFSELYGGSKSSWWSLNQECASYLTNFFTKKLNIGKFLRLCWGTDEFVIPTILMNSPLKDRIVNNNLRYIDFSKGGGNPKILELEDLDKLIHSPMLFARKFDTEVDLKVLDKIDEYYL